VAGVRIRDSRQESVLSKICLKRLVLTKNGQRKTLNESRSIEERSIEIVFVRFKSQLGLPRTCPITQKKLVLLISGN
jgi:hypothetical protein